MNKVLGDKKAILFFIFPALAIFTLVVPIPIINSFYYSFFDWNVLKPKVFIGFENYVELLKDDVFLKAILNTFIITVFSVISQVTLALILAIFIVGLKKVRNFFQAAYYIPNVLSSAIIGILWFYVLNYDSGLINAFLRAIGLGALQGDWLGEKWVIVSLIVVVCWQWVGYHMILYVAGISNIPSEIMEAAKVDGVQGIKMTTRIIIPLIWPVMKVTMILMIIGSLKFFDMAWIMSQGGPNHASETMATHLYMQAFWNSKFGYGSTISAVMFVLSLGIAMTLNKVFKSKNYEY